MSSVRAAALAFVVLLAGSTGGCLLLGADAPCRETITLKDGTVLAGRVVRTEGSALVFESSEGEQQFAMTDIDRLDECLAPTPPQPTVETPVAEQELAPASATQPVARPTAPPTPKPIKNWDRSIELGIPSAHLNFMRRVGVGRVTAVGVRVGGGVTFDAYLFEYGVATSAEIGLIVSRRLKRKDRSLDSWLGPAVVWDGDILQPSLHGGAAFIFQKDQPFELSAGLSGFAPLTFDYAGGYGIFVRPEVGVRLSF